MNGLEVPAVASKSRPMTKGHICVETHKTDASIHSMYAAKEVVAGFNRYFAEHISIFLRFHDITSSLANYSSLDLE